MTDDTLQVPPCDHTDPAQLAAWYGNFGYAEAYRKVVLAGCREAERAKATEKGEKVTEARLDDLSRLHSAYLEFLATHLHGRAAYEAMVRETMGLTPSYQPRG